MSPQGPGTAVDVDDQVVLLDPDRRPCGTAPRLAVHGLDTPLHLAFSSYLFDATGRLLVTRRALGKRTWPGVWTNSCCGHPRPGEDIAVAVQRRVEQELRLALTDLHCALPDFAYRATAADGLVENEVCPVYVARAVGDPDPDPAEVVEWRWVDWESYRQAAFAAPWALSPWSVDQMIAFGRAAHPLTAALHAAS
ncbi:isopentenyl-diphosphate Delta-isomerase [Frankia sp. AiPs1]|uniref:isopentenyl-diphosphate Delta-isomerase n=1 Tax=Frankia sp. AiPs1 TaxID=573493 RepID=UPI002044C9B5|nr:isopentenyl-diphosphate Delta-isomerase [Frankia sp. AiPs1]MCM3925010.1 isopentenyl-diphosphate Delta-isomerase [Frankia sp. AiPs1]